MTIAIVVSAVIVAIAIGAWMMQLNGGLVQTGMRNLDSWGLYIISFMWFVGLSAGGLIISSVPRVFGMKGFGGISKIAIWTSLACTCCAVGMIIIDLGNPLRIWELFAYSNLSSPLMWDVLVISMYFILSVAYLILTIRNEQSFISNAVCRMFSAVCLVVAVMVHTVTAWIIGVQVSHEFWNTALMGPWFVCSALVSGTALVLVVAIALEKAGYMHMEKANLDKMAKWLGGFCVIDLYFFGCDLLTSGWNGGAEGMAVVNMLTSGVLAPFFWGQVVFSVAAALICFMPVLRKKGAFVVAGILAMAAIFFKRVQLVVGGFQIPNINAATAVNGLTATFGFDGSSMHNIYSGIIYSPTPLEIGIFVGVLALGILIFLLGIKFLPLKPMEK